MEHSRTHGIWGVGVASPWRIAYTELKNKAPQSLPKIIALLKKHPDYAIEWQTQLSTVPQSDRDLYLFMLATRWADDARKTTAVDVGFSDGEATPTRIALIASRVTRNAQNGECNN